MNRGNSKKKKNSKKLHPYTKIMPKNVYINVIMEKKQCYSEIMKWYRFAINMPLVRTVFFFFICFFLLLYKKLNGNC